MEVLKEKTEEKESNHTACCMNQGAPSEKT